MPLYQVQGCARDSGQLQRRCYESHSVHDAVLQARAEDLIVSQVQLLSDEQSASSIEQPEEADTVAPSQGEQATEDIFPALQRLAGAGRTARITIWNAEAETAEPHLVEPYAARVRLEGQACEVGSEVEVDFDRILIHCYQLEAASGEGWRHLRLDLIRHVTDGGTRFRPRREVTLHTGICEPLDEGRVC